MNKSAINLLNNRNAPLDMNSEEFKKIGYMLVDNIASFLDSLPDLSVTTTKNQKEVIDALGNKNLPDEGINSEEIFENILMLLRENSLFNGHPKFWGYITSSGTPIGALGDLLASSINPNVGASTLAPIATEIEAQTIKWIADFIGFPKNCGGVLVSGGNMANFVGFLAARKNISNFNVREEGLGNNKNKLIVYVSKSTHTWIQKASDLFGIGTNSIRWIGLNKKHEMNIEELEDRIKEDKKNNDIPFMVVGNAGTVGTGTVDQLPELSKICKKYKIWFHVDGAYGAPAAALPEASNNLKGLSLADSVSLDPHKWLYTPLEAGCILVKEQQNLIDTFSFNPEYYNFEGDEDNPTINYFEYGMQNSRGFRALKVWLGFRSAGKNGFISMIRNDISLSKELFTIVNSYTNLQAISNNLSITTFRYIPEKVKNNVDLHVDYLNKLNEDIVNELQKGGKVFVSNAIINGIYVIRVCIVNFRTTLADIEYLPKIVIEIGNKLENNISITAVVDEN